MFKSKKTGISEASTYISKSNQNCDSLIAHYGTRIANDSRLAIVPGCLKKNIDDLLACTSKQSNKKFNELLQNYMDNSRSFLLLSINPNLNPASLRPKNYALRLSLDELIAIFNLSIGLGVDAHLPYSQ